MRLDQAVGQFLDVGGARRDGQGLEIAGPVEKLMLQREVA
jgi:hypothetical protein